MRFIAAAHPHHPLHQLGRELTMQDLRKYRHLVIRDTGSSATQRQLARRGADLDGRATRPPRSTLPAWVWASPGFPRTPSAANSSAACSSPCRCARAASVGRDLYLVFADRDYAGPGALRLAEIIREHVGEQCRRLEHEPARAAGDSLPVPGPTRQ